MTRQRYRIIDRRSATPLLDFSPVAVALRDRQADMAELLMKWVRMEPEAAQRAMIEWLKEHQHGR